MRDGTLIDIPETDAVADLDLKPALEQESTVTVFLALPLTREGRANVSADRRDDSVRYLLDAQQLEDENTGQSPQEVQVRLLNLRLLPSTESQAGFEILPIARIAKSSSGRSIAGTGYNLHSAGACLRRLEAARTRRTAKHLRSDRFPHRTLGENGDDARH